MFEAPSDKDIEAAFDSLLSVDNAGQNKVDYHKVRPLENSDNKKKWRPEGEVEAEELSEAVKWQLHLGKDHPARNLKGADLISRFKEEINKPDHEKTLLFQRDQTGDHVEFRNDVPEWITMSDVEFEDYALLHDLPPVKKAEMESQRNEYQEKAA